MEFGFFHDSSPWVVGVVIFVVNIAALEIGYRVGCSQRDKWKEVESGGGNTVLTSLFALLGLILAFTYAAGVSRHEVRKQNAVNEANVLGTAFLRAGLVDEPGRTELRKALYDYASTRLPDKEGLLTASERQEFIEKTLQAQAKLWPITESIVVKGQPDPIIASLVVAINDVLDQHALRLAAGLDKLPPAILWMLILIAAASLAVTGFNAGTSGRMSRWRMTIFAAVLAGVMYMIVDFDRPRDGMIQISLTIYENMVADLQTSLNRDDAIKDAEVFQDSQ